MGTHHSLANSRALGTVSGIIDGTGSVGAAIGQLVIIDLAIVAANVVRTDQKTNVAMMRIYAFVHAIKVCNPLTYVTGFGYLCC